MRWNRPWSLALLLTLPSRPLLADTLDKAYKAYEKGQFEEAAKGFGAHAQKKPDDYDQLYNAGVALLQKGAHDEALPFFDRAMQSSDPALKSRAAYNKGVALAQKQKWTEAAAAFQDALSYDNDNKMIQENLQFAREQKDQQQKSDPQQAESKAEEARKEAADKQAQNQQQKSESQQAENKPGQPQNADAARKDSADRQAQNQAAQNAQEQAAQQAAQAQKDQEKSVQEPPAAGQNQVQEQKQAAGSEKQPQLVDKDGQGSPGSNTGSSRVLTIKDLKKQEAEKLLRSVDDRVGTYILTPAQENTEGKSRNGKDW